MCILKTRKGVIFQNILGKEKTKIEIQSQHFCKKINHFR